SMPSPEILPWVVALLGGAALVIGAVGLMLRHRKGPPPEDPRLTQVITATERLSAIQGELAGRLSQLGETQTANTTALAQRLQDQERQITKVLEERLADVGRRVGEGLQKSSEKQSETLQDLRARLAVIDAAQQNITSLSQRVADLQDILANKQARGAFGQTRMEDLITDALPPGAYQFQAKLGNGRIADCLLPLPNRLDRSALTANSPWRPGKPCRPPRMTRRARRPPGASPPTP
ncbi:MAG: DNA recombination protein RmuC, partial [Rhodospirillaceae bacterium]